MINVVRMAQLASIYAAISSVDVEVKLKCTGQIKRTRYACMMGVVRVLKTINNAI